MRFITLILIYVCIIVLPAFAADISRISSLYNLCDGIGDIKLDGDYAYITSSPSTLRIYNITDPDSPELVGSIPASGRIDRLINSVLWLKKNSTATAVDVSDPSSPEIINTFSCRGNYELGVVISDNLIVVSGLEWEEIAPDIIEKTEYFYIWDISDLDNPELFIPRSPELRGGSYVLDEGILYEYRNRHLSVVDLSNPRSPRLLTETDLSAHPLEISSDGELLFVSFRDQERGYFIGLVDVSDPEEPEVITTFDYNNVSDIHVNENLLSMTYENEHLVTLDISDPESPEVVLNINTSGQGHELSIDDNLLAVVEANGSIEFIDISNPDEPDQVGLLENCGRITAIDVEGDYAYVAGGLKGFLVVDISDIETPREVGNLRRTINGNEITVKNGYAYVSSSDSGLYIIDITNPEEPQYSGRITDDENHYTQLISDSEWLYYRSNRTTRIYDLSNPAEPEQVSVIDRPGYIQVEGSILYCTNNLSLYKYDIRDRNNPQLISQTRLIEGNEFSSVGSFIVDSNIMSFVYHSVFFGGGPLDDPDLSSSLYFADVSTPDTISLLSNTSLGGGHMGPILGLKNRQLFLKYNDDVRIYSTWNPLQRPSYHSQLGSTYDPRQIRFKDDYAIVADHTSLSIYDCSEVLSNPKAEVKLTPATFGIKSTYPNPFNSTATINYTLPVASDISLELYNLLGQLVQTIFEGKQEAGTHSLNLVGDDLVSGLYFVKLNVSGQTSTQKIMLIK
jgi:hypothetical protein